MPKDLVYDHSWFDSFISGIDGRQDYLNRGVPTLVPFYNFPRLSTIIPGIIPGDNVIITANTGVGKSRFARKLFIKDIINYGKKNGMEVKIFLNSLEEPVEKVVSSFIMTELHKKYNLSSLSYYELNNFGTKAMSSDLRQKIGECKDKIDDIQNYLEITQIPNPYGFYIHILKWLFATGKFYKDNKIVPEFKDIKQSASNWDIYVPDNKNRLVIAISDTVDAYIAEGDKSQYQTILDFVKFFSRTVLGIRCGVLNVWIQQQSPELERIQTNVSGKTLIDKVKPGLDTLLACKATQQAATLVLALFDPVVYGEFNYYGYRDLRELNGDFMSLIILKGREITKKKGTEIPMIAHLGRDEFIELPRPDSKELKQFYSN